MTRTVEEIMTHDPRTVDAGASLVEVVIRAVAEGRAPESIPVREVASQDVRVLEPSESLDEAVRTMREHDIRRLPVVDGGRPIGIVSLGDVAVERDPDSALADISTGPPDQ